jgi:hypothetical protein
VSSVTDEVSYQPSALIVQSKATESVPAPGKIPRSARAVAYEVLNTLSSTSLLADTDALALFTVCVVHDEGETGNKAAFAAAVPKVAAKQRAAAISFCSILLYSLRVL